MQTNVGLLTSYLGRQEKLIPAFTNSKSCLQVVLADSIPYAVTMDLPLGLV